MSRFVAAIVAALLLAPSAAAHTDISASVAEEMIRLDPGLVVVDVRESFEFCGSMEHIADAANFPWASGVLQARVDELPTDVNLLVICASGSRSNQAATFLDGQGFTNVYDIQGGMNGWDFETEACDPSPMVSMHKSPGGPVINWTPTQGAQVYDMIRGVVEDIVDAGTYIDLGPTDCLSDDSPFTYFTDPEMPDGAFFYLARQAAGSWGVSSDQKDRSPASLNCTGEGD